MEQKTLFAVAVMEQCLFLKNNFYSFSTQPLIVEYTVFVAKFYHWFNSIHF